MSNDKQPIHTRRVPTIASLRRIIDKVLISDSDVDAFCLDFFQSVGRRFTDGMDRVMKVNPDGRANGR